MLHRIVVLVVDQNGPICILNLELLVFGYLLVLPQVGALVLAPPLESLHYLIMTLEVGRIATSWHKWLAYA